MKISGEDIGQWILPGILSVAIHACILTLLFGSRGCGNTPAPDPEPPPAAPSAVTDPEPPPAAPSTAEKPKPETRVNPPEKKGDATARAKPKADPKPKSKPKAAATPDPKSLDDLVEKPGQELVPEKPSTSKTTPAAAPAPAAEAAVYTVKPGDNFTHIARDHGCTPEDLAKFNGKDRKFYNVIRVGDRIKIPKKGDE